MSNSTYIYSVLTLALLALQGCIDPYDYPFEEKTNYLVVEGSITTEPGPHKVTLTTTRNIRNEKNAFKLRMQNARVTIATSSGWVERLVEQDTSGVYFTSADFRGEVGEKYQLKVVLEDSREYLSDSVQLQAMADIDSIGIKYGSESYVSELNSALESTGFFVDAFVREPAKQTSYYRARWRYTYLINTVGQTPRTCWINVSPLEYGVFSSEQVVSNNITQYPLFFLPVRGVMFAEKIKVDVTISSENFASYQFWNSVYNTTYRQGGVFDPTPAFIPSNVHSVNEPGEIVLGQFSASDVKNVTKNIYARDFPERVDTEINYTEPCFKYPREDHSTITDVEPHDWND
ncbi:MAG: DUF4249 domain-containing protein [Imperialibacter sp.]|uniref:DUF4249 domain-containing protein n=1 Tax=Imperialibacter sp. TaxID=2038411 RepID=UPI0032F03C50